MDTNRMSIADAAQGFEHLHAEGVESYGRFVEWISDGQRLARNLTPVGDSENRRQLSLIHTLPPPRAEIPLSVLIGIAQHALAGELEFLYALDRDVDVPEQSGAEPFRDWARGHRDRLLALCPEAFVMRPQAWLWSPPPLDQAPSTPGRLAWGEVLDRVSRTRDHRWRSAADAFVVLFVLIRDWYQDLRPLLDRRGIPASALLAACGVAAESERLGPSMGDILRWQGDLAFTNAQTLFTLLGRTGVFSVLGYVELDVAVAEGPADEPGEEPVTEPTETDAPPATGLHRPTSAIVSDLWTTDDELGYRPYAEALAAFIRDTRTKTPLTIGIKAPWGAGKTSLLRMVEKELARAPSEMGHDAVEGRLRTSDVLKAAGKPPELAAEEVRAPIRRESRTVWFNAWKYQSAEQLWAGLAHAIVEQVTRDMSPIERERFWAKINLRRVDLNQVRQKIHRAFLQRLTKWAVVAPAMLVTAGAAALLDTRVGGALGIGGALTVAGGIGLQWKSFIQEEAVTTIPTLVRDPGYDGRLGFLHLVHEDLERIIKLVATPDRPLVVFVDDLDRCSYSTVAQVIEGLNVFLSGQFPNCVFVIAMEPELVAAQIHVAYEKLFDRIERRSSTIEAADLGWRFLEKMVQLPLALPPPDDPAIAGLVQALSSGDAHTSAQIAEAPEDDPRLLAARERLEAKRAESAAAGETPSLSGLAEVVSAAIDEERPGDPGFLIRAARELYRDEFDDRQPEVQAVMAEFRPFLSANPREVKRFINVFRFYAYILFWQQTAGREALDLRGAGKLAALAIRAPEALGLLGRRSPVLTGRSRPELALLEDAAADDDAWRKAFERLDKYPSARVVPALRPLIAAEPKVGDLASGFL